MMGNVELDKRFNCQDCSPEKQEGRDCHGTLENPRRIPIISKVPWMYLDRCPQMLIDDMARMYWDEYYTYYISGRHLPYGGGYKNQPNIIMQVISYCASLIKKIEGDAQYIKWSSAQKKKQEDGDIANKEVEDFGKVKRKKIYRGR